LRGGSIRPGISRPQGIDRFNGDLVLRAGCAIGKLQSGELEEALDRGIVGSEAVKILTARVGVSGGNVPRKPEIELATTLREGNLVAGSIHLATTFTPSIGCAGKPAAFVKKTLPYTRAVD